MSSLAYILMGLLKDEPLTGYELNKRFQYATQFFWTTDQSQIYRALSKMHERGWVEIEYVVQEENPNKKIYHLTPSGYEALRVWLATPLKPEASRSPYLAQIFYGGDLTAEELIGVLEARLKWQDPEREELEKRWAEVKDYPDTEITKAQFLRRLTLEYGVLWYRLQRDFLKDAIARIRAKWEDET